MIKKNELQEIQYNSSKSFNELYGIIMSDLSKSKPKSYKEVKKIFTKNTYIDASEQIILNANYQSTLAGLGSSYAIVSLDSLNDYYLNTKFDGLKLSQRIHISQDDAVREVTKVINDQLKFRTNWKKLSKEISKKSNTVGDVSKELYKIYEDGNKFLSDKMSKKELKLFNKNIKKAQLYVDRLSQGNAPTKQLKQAYQEIINSVKIKDKELLTSAMNNAFKKKIAYNNDRISRTELSRANSQSFHRQIQDDDDISGWIWKLSPEHPKTDICDFYADLDNGEGQGVYTKDDSVSIPAHPHCLCMQQPYVVKGDRKTRLKPMSKKTSYKYLDKLSDQERGRVIGVRNAQFKSRYEKGLMDKGVVFGGSKPKALPKNLVTQKD